MKTKTWYVSDDEEEFDTKAECLEHEKRIKKGGIFLHGEITYDSLMNSLSRGYFLSNYELGKLSIFYPSPRGGLAGEIYGEIADELGALHDSWNYRVVHERMEKKGK